MASVIVDPSRIKEFATEKAFEAWLAKHHDKATEIWIRIYKKGSGVRSVTAAEAIDVVLCWGWIDGQRKGYDEQSFLQRYSPRRAKSLWSDINRGNVVRLIETKRMTPHGLRHVEAAKADGRWAAAYKGARTMTMPEDLMRAIEADKKALAMYEKLDKQKPLGARIPPGEPENCRRPREENRGVRADAQARRDDPSAEETDELEAGLSAQSTVADSCSKPRPEISTRKARREVGAGLAVDRAWRTPHEDSAFASAVLGLGITLALAALAVCRPRSAGGGIAGEDAPGLRSGPATGQGNLADRNGRCLAAPDPLLWLRPPDEALPVPVFRLKGPPRA